MYHYNRQVHCTCRKAMYYDRPGPYLRLPLANHSHCPSESFSHFPCLEGLELPLNGVVDAQLSPGDFPHLTNLDLSYNTLSGLIVIDLGLLPALRELHLTGSYLVVVCVPW